jgi:MFS family permease
LANDLLSFDLMNYFTAIKRALGKVFYGWWIVVASWVMFLVCGGTAYYGFTTFFNPIRNEFHWTAAQISIAFSLRSVEAGILAPAIGFLTDKLGARKIIVFGMIAIGIGMLIMSRTNSLLVFYLSFAVTSIGTSCALGSAQYQAAANWFREKRSWAIALISTGFGFSGIAGPLLVWLIAQYGWRNSSVFIAIVAWVIGIPLGMIIRHRPEPYGYLPDGESADAPTQNDNTATTDVTNKVEPEVDLTVRQAIVTRAFWMLILFGLLTGFAQSAIMVHEMPYLTSVGISRGIAGWVILGITGSSIIGRLSFGWLGDRYDKRYLLAIGAALQFIGTLVFAYIREPWMLFPFLLFYGPGYASQIPLYPATRADYFGLKHFATIGGLISLGWTTCGIVAPVLAGWVYDTTGSYRLIWLVYAIASAAAIPTVLWIKGLKTKAK